MQCPDCGSLDVDSDLTENEAACYNCHKEGSFDEFNKEAMVKQAWLGTCPRCGKDALVVVEPNAIKCESCGWTDSAAQVGSPPYTQHEAGNTDVQYCPQCGEPIEVDPDQPALCPNCNWLGDMGRRQAAPVGEMGTTELYPNCPECDGETDEIDGMHHCVDCDTWVSPKNYDSNSPADARSEDTDAMLQDFGGGMAYASSEPWLPSPEDVAKMRGESHNFRGGNRSGLSAQEQQELINEPGTARNANKLNLDGTHYTEKEEEDLATHFLW